MPTIQFYDLEDMIPELRTLYPVRLTRIVNPLGFRTRDIAVVQVLVIARQHKEESGDTLSWMMSTGEYEIMNGEPITDTDVMVKTMAWEEAAYVMDVIHERLIAMDHYDVKPGLLAINDTPLLGEWSLLEITDVHPSDDGEQEVIEPGVNPLGDVPF